MLSKCVQHQEMRLLPVSSISWSTVTNETKVVGLASLNSSVSWPQTFPLASASSPQNMCPWPQSRVGEKVQTNQFKTITTTRQTAQSTCPADYRCIPSSSCMMYSKRTPTSCDFIGSRFSAVYGQFIFCMPCIYAFRI